MAGKHLTTAELRSSVASGRMTLSGTLRQVTHPVAILTDPASGRATLSGARRPRVEGPRRARGQRVPAPSARAARPASSRATGMRNGEQDT